MSGLALALILTSAVIHATWNYLAKRAGAAPSDMWPITGVSMLLYAPLALGVVVLRHPSLGSRELLFMSGTAVLHTAYFVLLMRGYQAGALSIVYPLARGTGPLLSTVAAIALLGERPTWLAMTGAALIGASVFLLAGGPRGLMDRRSGRAILYALLTGATIATYTLWDKYAVSGVGLHPLVLEWGGGVGRFVLLTPLAVRQWESIRRRLRTHRREIIGAAILIPLAYILVLTALVFTPVSYVAPLREVSILIGTAMGAGFLAEGEAARRLAAAAMMVVGVLLLAFG